MSDMLPAKIERVWMVDTHGSAVEKREPPKPLTSGQRHRMYRLGLVAIDRFLKEKGFRPNCEESQNTLSYEKSRVCLDLKLKRPDNIAFVTSFPGYEYRPDVIGKTADGQERYRVNAKVTSAKDILGSDYVIQVMVSTNDAVGSRAPIFIPLPKEVADPTRYVIQNVLGIIAMACQHIPMLRDAFTKKEVEAAQERRITEAEAAELNARLFPLLPD
jgi:hypothetical protein